METDDGHPLRDGLPVQAPSPDGLGHSAGIPDAQSVKWQKGKPNDIHSPSLIWLLGRCGDVFGPIPGEMIADDAWEGYMFGAANDIVAWAPYEGKWRDAIPECAGLGPMEELNGLR